MVWVNSEGSSWITNEDDDDEDEEESLEIELEREEARMRNSLSENPPSNTLFNPAASCAGGLNLFIIIIIYWLLNIIIYILKTTNPKSSNESNISFNRYSVASSIIVPV